MKKFIEKYTGTKNKLINWFAIHIAVVFIVGILAFIWFSFKYGWQ